MNCATAIIDASWRVRSAMPWESPAKPAAVRNDASRITNQPTAPPFVAPSRRPVSRINRACSVATIDDSRMRPKTIAPRLAGVARNRSRTPRSRSSIIPIPAHDPEKNAVIIATPGVR